MSTQRAAYSYLRPQHRGFKWFLAGSLALHLAVIAAYAYASAGGRPTIDLTERAIMTKLVRMGTKKDPKLLPRKEAAPAAKPDEALLAVDREEEPPKEDLDRKKKDALKKIEEESKRKQAKEDALRRIADRVGDEEPAGNPDGSSYGSESEGALSLTQAYFGQLHDRIKAFYTVPAIISEAERRHLVAVVVVHVAPDGTILKHEFERTSGNDAFDRALEGALQRASPLPSPPAFLKDTLREGVALRFRP